MPVIELREQGLYCPGGDFYIDPWMPVPRAVITHAHSDHAKAGHGAYLCHTDSVPLLRLRLGNELPVQSLAWNEPLVLGDVTLSLFPAGHIIGSSQVRMDYRGEVWVASGDYKTEDDGLSETFEAVPCHCFITESTFGLPIYRWKPQASIFADMERWIHSNRAAGLTSVLFAYSLGKAQRLIRALGGLGIPIFVHGAIWNVQEALRAVGWDFPSVQLVTPDMPRSAYLGQIVIAPPSADDSPWLKRFLPYSLGVCSGWMQVRGNVRRRNADAGFVLSDHADWAGLLTAVKATGAQRVLVTHGFQASFARYLSEDLGVEAAEVRTAFGDEDETATPGATPPDAPDAGAAPPALPDATIADKTT